MTVKTADEEVVPEGQSVRILYMEDDAGLGRLLQKTLRRSGYTVDIAENGQVGLEMVRQRTYDVLLVDNNMPVLGGMEVIKALASEGNCPPAIMVTGNGNEKIAVEAMKEGATDYIVKDADMGYLQLLPVVIEKVLQKQVIFRERERMFETIRESEERYRKLVELSPDGIAIVVRERFVFVNNAGARMLCGTVSEDLMGRPLLEFVHPGEAREFQGRLSQMQLRGETAHWKEKKFVRLDGDEIDVELAGVPFVYGGERAVQIIFRDVTELKYAERERERLIQRLQDALSKVKKLSGLVPICASCKKIRDDSGYWNQIEAYIEEHSDAEFSHGFCPECAHKLYPEYYKKGSR